MDDENVPSNVSEEAASPKEDGELALDAELPKCSECNMPMESIKYMDYGEIRVVFHEGRGCLLGILYASHFTSGLSKA